MKVLTAQTGAPRHGLSRLGGDAAVVALGQLSSVVYPLISIPILSHILGTDGFGQLLLAMAIVNVLVLFVDFGFAMSALRRVSLALTVSARASIVAATVTAKALLFVGGGAVLGFIVLLTPGLRDHWQLYLIGILLTAGDVAYPTWLLQGIGRIKTFALLNAASRLIALGGLLLTVTSASDVSWAIFWQFAPATIAAMGSWIFLTKIRCHQMDRPTLKAAVSALKESFPLFIGSVATIVISAMNTVLLGAFSVIQEVAFYGAAERFSNALRGILGGVQQSMLPRMSASIGATDGRTLRRRILTGLIVAYGLAGIGLILTADVVIPWYLGDDYKAAIPVAKLLGVALCVTGVSTALTLALIAHGQARISSRVLIAAAVFHLILLPILCSNFGALGAAGGVCATEILIACLLGWSYRRFLDRNRFLESIPDGVRPGEAP